jgi:hypothetical protein
VLDDDVVDADDVRAVQAPGGTRFPQHALGLGRPQLLERDLASDDPVLGEPDDPHAAPAELSDRRVSARDQPRRVPHARPGIRTIVPTGFLSGSVR